MQSRNEKALKVIAIAIAALTYVGAVVYGDIMFLQVMGKAFPSAGLLRTLAMAGAIMTAVSALGLPLALHWWFAPGLQFIWGIVFWGLDIAALALNSILAYQSVSTLPVDSLVGTWQSVSPATPLLAVIGWGIAFLLDPSRQQRHAHIEMQADQIEIFAEKMKQAAKSDQVYNIILQAAEANAREYAQALLGQRLDKSWGSKTVHGRSGTIARRPSDHLEVPASENGKEATNPFDRSEK